MQRLFAWMALGVIVASPRPGWAASNPTAAATTAAAVANAPTDVDRLEILLDAVDQLDGEIQSLKQQAAATHIPGEQERLQAQREALQQQRAGLAAQVESLLPAFPALQQRWKARHTAERSGAIEQRIDQQLKRQEILLENTANTRARR
ncbi:MAG: hypothetical protein HY597_02245 [Candidatus Omnitrophica bacterium]|nr:hypothetical protein [Candidatus Omnitrophota bacterium]